MKDLHELEKMSLEDLQRIGADESIPVPADLQVRLPRRMAARGWSLAAAAAILLGLGWWGMNRPEEPKDTFDDPYLAYAAVEQALSKMSGTIHETARTVSEKEMQLEKINYWK
ncbi:MAG: hypothetical protein J6M23_05645 [Bacteroidales bacterium]|nr:hypothetical protein [Bacteroidales bacterium]